MTSTTLQPLRQIHVDAPDGRAALELERRLAYLDATVACVQGRWSVELFDDGDRDEAIDSAVRRWLRDLGRIRTFVRIDGLAHEVIEDHGFVVDYEQRVIEHEP